MNRQPFPVGIQPGDFVNPGGFWFGDIWLEVTRILDFGNGYWSLYAIQYTKYGTCPLEIELSFEGVRKAVCGPMAVEVLKFRRQRIYGATFRYDPYGIKAEATTKPRPRTPRG